MLIILLIIIIIIIMIIFFIIKKNINEYFSSSYTAIIVEPRKHKALEYVLNNFLENLDDKWNIILFHGNLNEDYSKDIIYKNKHKNRIKLINLKVDNLTISDYSNLFYSKDFYNYIPTEIFLVFQTDTIICSQYKDYIYKFIEYDYVGAPWKDGRVGNGGLSLRKKSKMLEILNKCSLTDIVPEDRMYEDKFFSISCNKVTNYKPTFEKAKEFSIETVLNDKSFGLHKAYAYQDIDIICKWCPEIIKLKELNTN